MKTAKKLRCQQQNIRLNILIHQLGIDSEAKMLMVLEATDGRASSSKELYEDEAQSLITHLTKLTNPTQSTYNQEGDRMRKKILSICHEMGWETEEGKVDFKHLNDWLKKYGYLHKKLNDYTYIELPELVTQFESVLTSFYTKK